MQINGSVRLKMQFLFCTNLSCVYPTYEIKTPIFSVEYVDLSLGDSLKRGIEEMQDAIGDGGELFIDIVLIIWR